MLFRSGRVENQQKFLKALAGQVLQIKNVTKIRSIAEAVFKNVKTDFSAGELLWMGMQAMQIDNSSIQFFTPVSYTHLDVYKRQEPLAGQRVRGICQGG